MLHRNALVLLGLQPYQDELHQTLLTAINILFFHGALIYNWKEAQRRVSLAILQLVIVVLLDI